VPGTCRIKSPITATIGAAIASIRVIRRAAERSGPGGDAAGMVVSDATAGLSLLMVKSHPRPRWPRTRGLRAGLAGLLLASALVASGALGAAGSLQPPEQFIGFKVGADNKLVRWDKIVEYMRLAAAGSDRVRVRELGKTTGGNSFLAVEIAAPETLKNLDRHKQFSRKLYFQDGAPTARERDEIFRQGKLVVLVTCSVHANEIGATQMALELVHRLATDESPAVKKILDNVIFILIPSANPDGQIAITDWFHRNVDTPFSPSPLPSLYHPYAGHDLNRDMYMMTQKESQFIAQLAWHEWFPVVWLDQHQMGPAGPRMFVMPASDPINPNVHPLVYRWNGILGQSQAAALEAAGKDGIIYNSTYTNFWQGALAWSGWWHNQIGLLTEVASVRIAAPVQQLRATLGASGALSGPELRGGIAFNPFDNATLAPPSDVQPRTEYPRPWLGGRWTLRDIVDYELISTMALLETAADRREAMLRQIYEVNRQTVEEPRKGEVAAILVPMDGQQDAREAAHLVDRLQLGGVEVFRGDMPFEADGRRYPAGTLVIPMTQVFSRYAKDLLEKQIYPEVRRGPNDAIEPPYDVTAWSLGMLMGVDVQFAKAPIPSAVKLAKLNGRPRIESRIAGNGARFVFDYVGADTAIAINRLLKDGARVVLERPSQVAVTGIARDRVEALAREFGLNVAATQPASAGPDLPDGSSITLRTPRIGLYSPWTGGNMDEGWTRWVLEQYEFAPTTIHNADIRRGGLKQRFDAIILPDQAPREILDGFNAETIRPEYRGGIGEAGVDNLSRFVADGGTLITLGNATDLAIDRLPVPVRNIKRGLRREQHYAPGTILRIQVDTSHPEGYGMATATYGFYSNGPVLATIDGFTSLRSTVVARYPAVDIVASGWLKGEEIMAGRAAVVSIEMNPGRVVLFGLRPQHRGQTHATFPLLFNSLYLASSENGRFRSTNQQ
jgi:hypothetical protein